MPEAFGNLFALEAFGNLFALKCCEDHMLMVHGCVWDAGLLNSF